MGMHEALHSIEAKAVVAAATTAMMSSGGGKSVGAAPADRKNEESKGNEGLPPVVPPKNSDRASSPPRRSEYAHLLSVLIRYGLLFGYALVLMSELHDLAVRWNEDQESMCHVDDAAAMTCSARSGQFQYASEGGRLGAILRWAVTVPALQSRLLLYGYRTRESLLLQMYESSVAAICWGATFVAIRKGLNPRIRGRRDGTFVAEHGVAASYGALGIFHSGILRGSIKSNVSRKTVRSFARWFISTHLLVFAPSRFVILKWFGNDPDILADATFDALLIGLCWGLSQLLVRRRLDPKTSVDMLRRSWKDVLCGSVALSTSSLLKCVLRGVGQSGRGPPWDTLLEGTKVGACWGVTSLFLRRGLNPDTRKGFLSKYWIDVVFGSFALVGYSFLKLAVKENFPFEATSPSIAGLNQCPSLHFDVILEDA